MRTVEFNVSPGVVKDDTERRAARKGRKRRWVDSDRIRFVGGLPQKLGGWQKFISDAAVIGKGRGMLSWISNSNVKYIAIGTHKKLYAMTGLALYNITPIRATDTPTDPFTTTASSAEVLVASVGHGAVVGDYVEISGASAVGGITIDGNYLITGVPDGDSFTIDHTSAATSSASGGGSVTLQFEIQSGLEDSTEGAGYGVGGYGSGTYGTSRATSILIAARTWRLEQWGEYLVACHSGGSIYEWQLDTGVRAQVLSNAPTDNKGIFVTDEQHLVALGAGGDELKVEWSDQSDNTTWSPTDTNTAGGRTLAGGEKIQTGLRTRGSNLILTDSAAWLMTFIGGQDVFGFAQASAKGSGIIGPNAATEVDGTCYWMGNGDFFVFDGFVRRLPNSQEIRRFVFDNLTEVQREKVYCVSNTAFSEIWWFYPTSTENDMYVKYTYAGDGGVWDVGTMARTAAIDRSTFTTPMMMGDDGYIYQHETGNDDDGSAMNEYIRSGIYEVGDGNQMFDVLGIIPDVANLTGSLDVTLLSREYPHGTEESTDAGDITTSTTKLDDFRASGRQLGFQIGSAFAGTEWRWGTMRFEIEETGGPGER